MPRLLVKTFFLLCLASSAIAENESNQIFNVADYGAIGDGQVDDAPAIRQAVAAAIAAGPGGTVVLPEGVYRLGSTEETRHRHFFANAEPGVSLGKITADGHIIIHHAHDLTIQGQGRVELIATSPYHHAFHVIDSQGVTLRDLIFDYDPLPFTQGTIVAFDAESPDTSFDLKLDEGFDPPTREDFTEAVEPLQARRAIFFDPDTGHIDHTIVPKYHVIEIDTLDEAKRLYRFHFDRNSGEDLRLGAKAVVIARRPRHAVRFLLSQNSGCERVTVYSSPALAFNLMFSDALFVRDCVIEARPGSGRLQSLNADGVHVKFNRVGPIIEGNRFTQMDDDAVNIGSGLLRVCKQEAPDTLLVDKLYQLRSGDTVYVISGNDGSRLAEATIIRSELAAWRDNYAMRLVLDRPVDVQLTVEQMNGDTPRIHPTRKPMDQRDLPTLIASPEAAGKNAIVRDNHFYHHRARAVLMRSPGGIIENNRFEHLQGPGVIAGQEFPFLEGPAAQEITIRNNTFSHIPRSNIYVAHTDQYHQQSTKGTISHGLRIEGNTFEFFGGITASGRGTPDVILDLHHIDGVTIVDNIFGPPDGEAQQPRVLNINSLTDVEYADNRFIRVPGFDDEDFLVDRP